MEAWKLIWPILMAVLLASCRLCPIYGSQRDAIRDVRLHVCNWSAATSPVDIRVEIDGRTVVWRCFSYGSGVRQGHNWKSYAVQLSEGKHSLRVRSLWGDARLEASFEIGGGPNHLAVCYVHENETNGGPSLPQIRFRQSDFFMVL
jgi:hypothetical protein